MFYDDVVIAVTSGRGGDGCVSFRREAMVPRGGPDGGNGGRGGDVILRVNRHLNTLQHFQHQRTFIAKDGDAGRNKDQTGKSADKLYIDVPPGTSVFDVASGNLVGDLKENDAELVVARGGRGGRGNATFTTATHQAPEIATRGSPGESREIRLELKLIADIGIVGLPNAGKSTLLSVLTAAKPKIADYPFTTLVPNLGVSNISAERSVVLADIPGLIEGASQGAGLGHEFLRHIERTRVLIHVLDGMSADPLADYATIQSELREFGHGLADKPQVLALSKMDLPDARAAYELFIQGAHDATFRDCIPFSSASGENVRKVLNRAVQILDELPPEPEPEIMPILEMTPNEEGDAFSVEHKGGKWVVHSAYLESIVEITRWDLDEATMRFQSALDRSGVAAALERAGVQPGDMVKIGDYELEWQDETEMSSRRRRSRANKTSDEE
jgi:GTP-binding protein